MDAAVPLLVLLATGVVGLMAWGRVRRRASLRAWAAQRGWRYTRSDRALVRDLRGGPFGAGNARMATEILDGTFAGRPARSFCYSYQVPAAAPDGGTRTYRFHVVQLALPAVLPTIELGPPNGVTRLARLLGARQADFESEEFNRAWCVRGPQQQVTYDVVHPRMMERLLDPDLRGQSLLVEAGALMWWSDGSPTLDRVEPALRRLTEVADLLPRYLWQDLTA